MWISVREQLPAVNGYYLVFDGQDQMVCWFQYRDHQAQRVIGPLQFYDDYNKLIEVTHWQLLPAAPVSWSQPDQEKGSGLRTVRQGVKQRDHG
jgi:hypothetical protein